MNEEIKSSALTTDKALTDEVLEQVDGGWAMGEGFPITTNIFIDRHYTLSHNLESELLPKKP